MIRVYLDDDGIHNSSPESDTKLFRLLVIRNWGLAGMRSVNSVPEKILSGGG